MQFLLYGVSVNLTLCFLNLLPVRRWTVLPCCARCWA